MRGGRETQRSGADGTPPARGSLGLLTDRVFGPYFVGKVLSMAGAWIHNIVAAILAFELTGSAFVVGLVSVAQFLPQLLFAPLSGAAADRGDRRVQILFGRVVSAAGSGGLALWVALAGVEGLPGAAPVIGAALVVGSGFVIGGPAMQALVPRLVRPAELAPAIALSSVPFTIARAGGPAVGALVAAAAGPATAFAIAAGSHLVFAAIMVWLPVDARADRSGDPDRSVRAGLRHLRADPTLIFLLVAVTAVGVGADPAITLTPPLSAHLGRGSELVGAFASAFGVGAGLGFFALSPLRRTIGLPWLGTTGLVVLGASMLLLTVTPSPLLAVLTFAAGGVGMTFGVTSISTQMQARLPDRLRGRVMALWSVAFLGSRPFAAAMNGAIADAVSVDAAFAAVAVVLLAAAWLCRPTRVAALPRSS